VELSIEATAAVWPEGDSPENTLFTFTVTRSGDLSATTSVDYVVGIGETATADADDFGGTLPAGTIVFSADEASVEISIGVSGDDQVEVDENFTVMLLNPSLDAVIVNAESVGTILGDDSGAVIIERTVLLVGTDGRDNITVVKSPRRFRTLLILTVNDLVNQDRRRFRVNINDVDDIVVLARGGNDRVSVATDIVIPLTADGGAGRDTLSGGSGADLLFGGSGKDRISGRNGNDILIGGDDNDLLRGGSGDDQLYGNGGNDVLNGGRGNDTISAGMGNDVALGGSGNDLIDGGAGDDRLRGGSDDDAIRGGIGNDFLNGNAGSDQLDGDDSEDTLRGDAATDLDGLFADIEEWDQLILPW
jgi:Ca2+-binding RTX toxin-like protein